MVGAELQAINLRLPPPAPIPHFNPQSLIPNPLFRPRRRPSAFTLIELLVVISIMVILMGLAATMMRPDLEGRRTREAARSVNVYVSSARNRAMETGRPCGVVLHRLTNADGTPSPVAAALSMDQCEVPPPFAGNNIGSVVRVQDWTIAGGGNPTILKVQIRSDQTDFPDSLIRVGDLVQLNGQGPIYSINYDSTRSKPADFTPDATTGYIKFSDGNDTDGDKWIDDKCLTLYLDPVYSQQTPWPKSGAAWSQSPPVPFSILRQAQPPKGTETPLQLPAGAAIDLDFSGIDNTVDPTAVLPTPPPKYPDSLNGTWFDATWFDTTLTGTPGDVTILFGPTGSVQNVSIANVPYSPFSPTRPIFLLIGKRERIPANNGFNVVQGNPATWPNWYDLKNVWVVINPQSGLISTGENGSVASDPSAEIGTIGRRGGSSSSPESYRAPRRPSPFRSSAAPWPATRRAWEGSEMRGIRDWGLGIRDQGSGLGVRGLIPNP